MSPRAERGSGANPDGGRQVARPPEHSGERGADDASRLQIGQLLGGQAEEIAEDLGVVLAERRRRAAVHRSVLTGKAERERDVGARPAHRVLDLLEEAAGVELFEVELGRRVDDDGGGHAGGEQRVDDVRRSPLGAPRTRGARRSGRAPRGDRPMSPARHRPPTADRRAPAEPGPLLVGGHGDRHPAVLVADRDRRRRRRSNPAAPRPDHGCRRAASSTP